MDIKEIGATGFIVVGGVVYGVSQYGLESALSEDLKPVHEVSYEQRAAYMDSVRLEFSDNFETYIIQTETYDYIGTSKFSTDHRNATFVEVVKQDEIVPKADLKAIREQLKEESFCAQSEMTMFTDKGWNYKFTLRDGRTQKIASVTCRATTPNAAV